MGQRRSSQTQGQSGAAPARAREREREREEGERGGLGQWVSAGPVKPKVSQALLPRGRKHLAAQRDPLNGAPVLQIQVGAYAEGRAGQYEQLGFRGFRGWWPSDLCYLPDNNLTHPPPQGPHNPALPPPATHNCLSLLLQPLVSHLWPEGWGCSVPTLP